MSQPPSGPSAPPPHQWYAAAPAPGPMRPPRPAISLASPLVWTAFFTGVGIALLVAALCLLVVIVALFHLDDRHGAWRRGEDGGLLAGVPRAAGTDGARRPARPGRGVRGRVGDQHGRARVLPDGAGVPALAGRPAGPVRGGYDV